MLSGKDGNVDVGGTDVAEITSWSFNPTANVSAWGSSDSSGYKKRLAGTKDGTGSMAGKFKEDDQMHATFKEGDEVTLKLYLDSTRR